MGSQKNTSVDRNLNFEDFLMQINDKRMATDDPSHKLYLTLMRDYGAHWFKAIVDHMNEADQTGDDKHKAWMDMAVATQRALAAITSCLVVRAMSPENYQTGGELLCKQFAKNVEVLMNEMIKNARERGEMD